MPAAILAGGIRHRPGPVLFLLTGGTIDFIFEPTADGIVPSVRSAIPEYIQRMKLRNNCSFVIVCMKDSRDLNEEDRKRMVHAIRRSRQRMVIITHGTYTMADTARYLRAHLGQHNKTIVLTGSMIPLSGFMPSDAQFNLGYALAYAQILPHGIYVCMNGQVFKPEEVRKNILEGRFEKKNSSL